MEYECDTELEPNSNDPSKNNAMDFATDNPSNVRSEPQPKQVRDTQTAVLIPEEEEVG